MLSVKASRWAAGYEKSKTEMLLSELTTSVTCYLRRGLQPKAK